MTPPNNPETLARIAGLPGKPADPARAVLVLIDAQTEYTEGRVPLAGIDAAVEEGARLLACARAVGMPIFHAIHHGAAGGALFDPAGGYVDFIPALEPRPGERVLVKRLPNAFAGTDLAAKLRATGRTELILAGFATHMCVSATARAALDHGYRATIVAAATATRDLPGALGSAVVTAAQVQAAALAALSDRFSVVVRDTWGLCSNAAHAARSS